jgi:hypothetical protein
MSRSLRSRLVAGGDRTPPSGIQHLFPHGLFFSVTSVTRSGGNLCDLDRTSRPFTLKELDHDPVGFPDPSCRDAPAMSDSIAMWFFLRKTSLQENVTRVPGLPFSCGHAAAMSQKKPVSSRAMAGATFG